jgi:mRNA-degrading endonuclease HigB of HigAB toxin-antitoxin module
MALVAIYLLNSAKLMHVITRKRLNEFAETHPDARSSLAHWYAINENISIAIHARFDSLISHSLTLRA